MPIYEETYHSWDGGLEEHPRTWWVIAKTGIRLAWKKSVIFLLIVASIPFFVRAVQIYLMTRYGDQVKIGGAIDRFKINPQFFADYLQGAHFLLLLVFILIGAGLIANDRKFKALSIYFSKPVGFWDYVIGKWIILAFYGSLVTLVPSLLLFLIRVLVDDNAVFIKQFYWIPFSILGYVIISLLVLGAMVLALSAVAKGTRSAAIFFFALIMFPEAFRQFLYRVPSIGLFSINADIRQAGSVLFGVKAPFDYSVLLSWIVLAAFIGLGYLLLKHRVRPTEVIR